MFSHDPFRDIIGGFFGTGDAIVVLGITGQAGAGKTTHIAPLAIAAARDLGCDGFALPLDAFFILSSQQRRLWLAEGERISPEEGAQRRDQLRWWNFDYARQTLRALRNGDGVHLRNVYNRADGGELTGEIRIPPAAPGGKRLITFDGVATPEVRDHLDRLMYVHAPAPARLGRLRSRDRHRQGAEVLERFKLTQEFEIPYFQQRWPLIDHFVDNSEVSPRVLEPMSPDAALAASGLPSALD